MALEKVLNKSLILSILINGFAGLGYIQLNFVLISNVLFHYEHTFKTKFALFCSCALLGIYTGKVVLSLFDEYGFWAFEVVFITLSIITYNVINKLLESGNGVIQKPYVESYMEKRNKKFDCFFLALILGGKAILFFSHERIDSKDDETLVNLLYELCPSLTGTLISLVMPFSYTSTTKSLILNLLYGSTYILISFSSQSSVYFLISKSINNCLFFTLFIHYTNQLSYIPKHDKLFRFKESYPIFFTSSLILICSFSIVFAYLYNFLFLSLIKSQFSLVYYSVALIIFSTSLHFLYKGPETNSNILETEPAEAVNTKTINSEKSFPDNCKSFISDVQPNYSENLNMSIDEKSIQDFEYNCVGISCGYFGDEQVLNEKREIKEKFQDSGIGRKSRKSNSFDDVIIEQSNEDSSNDHMDIESKASSGIKKRRNSEGSKIEYSELMNQVSLCSDENSSYHSFGVLKEGSLSSLS